MKRRPAVFLVTAGLACFAASISAADYPAAASALPAQPVGPVAATNTNPALPQPGELELRSQLRLLSELAQEHRQLAEAAAKSDQAQRARWETALAEQLSNRGSNILVRLDRLAAQKQEPSVGGQTETAALLSAAEDEYLARIQDRLQAVQQELDAATAETTAYALQSATNRNTVVYGDYTDVLRTQEIARNIRRLQAEQAELQLKISQFWAFRAMVRNAQNVLPR